MPQGVPFRSRAIEYDAVNGGLTRACLSVVVSFNLRGNTAEWASAIHYYGRFSGPFYMVFLLNLCVNIMERCSPDYLLFRERVEGFSRYNIA